MLGFYPICARPLVGEPPQTLALAIGAGSYTLTGRTVRLAFDHMLPIGSGTYTFTGKAVIMSVSMPAAVGTYTLSGQNVALIAIRKLYPGAGSYTLSGKVVRLSAALPVLAGSYTLTGQNARLAYMHNLPIGAGAFTLTGKTARLAATRFFYPSAGSYAFAGKDVEMRFNLAFAAGKYIWLTGLYDTEIALDGRYITERRLGRQS